MNERNEFGALYDRNFSKVYNYVRYRVTSPDAADDITSRIFEQALDKLDSYDESRAPFEVWLFAIARNAVLDWFREGKRYSSVEPEVLEDLPDGGPRPEAILEDDERNKRLLAAIAGLDERSRDIIALKFTSRLNNREIAGLTGLSESNIAVIIYRAVKQLQTILKQAEMPQIGDCKNPPVSPFSKGGIKNGIFPS